MQTRKGCKHRNINKMGVIIKRFMRTGVHYPGNTYSNRSKEISRESAFNLVTIGGITDKSKEIILEGISNRRYPYNAIKKRIEK